MRLKVEFSRDVSKADEEFGLSGSSHPSFGCPLGSLAIPHELSPLADLLSFLLAVVLDRGLALFSLSTLDLDDHS